MNQQNPMSSPGVEPWEKDLVQLIENASGNLIRLEVIKSKLELIIEGLDQKIEDSSTYDGWLSDTFDADHLRDFYGDLKANS